MLLAYGKAVAQQVELVIAHAAQTVAITRQRAPVISDLPAGADQAHPEIPIFTTAHLGIEESGPYQALPPCRNGNKDSAFARDQLFHGDLSLERVHVHEVSAHPRTLPKIDRIW